MSFSAAESPEVRALARRSEAHATNFWQNKGVDLSVIIPTCNRPKSLLRVVRPLLPQISQSRHACELIIVDDGGAREAERVLHDSLDKDAISLLKTLRLSENRGPSAARNAGINVATGKILAFLDDDCVPAENYIDETLRIHNEYPHVLLLNGDLVARSKNIYSRFWFYYYNAAFNGGEGEVYPVTRVASGHCSIKRELLDSFSPLFDDKLRSREDYDLWLRLKKVGIQPFKAETIKAGIECRSNLRSFLEQRAWYAEGEDAIRQKHDIEHVLADQSEHFTPPSWRFLHLHLATTIYLLLKRNVGEQSTS